MADEQKPPKKLGDMTAAELEQLIDDEDKAHRTRLKYLRALARAVGTTPAAK